MRGKRACLLPDWSTKMLNSKKKGLEPMSRTTTIVRGLVLVLLTLTATPQVRALEDYVSPLEPPDTSSPRATLKAFRENFERGFRDFYKLHDFKFVDRPSQVRAQRTLDLSKLPPVQRRRLSAEAIILLNEVFDKIELPPNEEIPDADAMRALPPGEPRRWQVPGSEIVIELIEEGPRAGEYLFSSGTVSRVHEFYHRAENLPYRPGAMENFYRQVIAMGGSWIPLKVTDAFPNWLKTDLLGQATWKWIAMPLAFCLWIAIALVFRRLAKPPDAEPHYWLRFVFTLALLPLTTGLRHFMDQQLLITGAVYSIVDTSIVVLYAIVGAMAIIHLGAAVASSLIASPRIDKESIDANLISVSVHSLGWLAAILFLAKGASQLGVPLAAVITSLGVGGLAFAMAARPTLENLIAGVTLYLDKPVRVGQFCQFEDVLGTVERIGLRSTRIRRWGGNVLSIPNSQFAEYQLDNYNDSRYIWIRQRLRLRYETSADQLKFILAKLREMLFAHPKVLAPRVRLIGFGEDAMTVEILAYSDTGVWSEWHAIREDVYLRVMEIIEQSGTRLALPSQTTYFARDDGLDDEKKKAAEQQVLEWKEKGELPFPDMTAEQQEALSGTLDFPPEGSIEYKALEQSEAAEQKS
jgi:MscS family membrane protein